MRKFRYICEAASFELAVEAEILPLTSFATQRRGTARQERQGATEREFDALCAI